MNMRARFELQQFRPPPLFPQTALKKQKQISAWGPQSKKAYDPYATPCASFENAKRDTSCASNFFCCSSGDRIPLQS
jgi:hypothetical protein